MINFKRIDLLCAQKLIEIGIETATNIQSPSNIAVVDSFGYLISYIRMDEAQLPSIEHSINKAYTSALLKKPTKDLRADSQPDGDLYGLNITLDQRVIVFAGGIPLALNEEVVGAVGVSGGTAEQDQFIAESIAYFFSQSFTEN